MYLNIIKNLMISNGLNKAAIAKRAGVSRAAVTKWFHNKDPKGWVNVETRSLLKLANALNINPETLLIPAPELDQETTTFLWDRLYPDMAHFVHALAQHQRPAVARLVQVVGFHDAGKILGRKIISDFPKYAKYIKPVRRKQLEVLWPLYNSKK